MASILVLGHACIDLITLLPRRPEADEKIEALDHYFGGGGPAANAAVALSRLGHEVRLATALGDDRLGQQASSELRDEGVDLLVAARPGRTSIAQIQVVGSQRCVAWQRGTAAALDPDPPTVDRWLEGVELVYVDGHEIVAASAVIRAAVERGIEVVADLGSLRPGVAAWLPQLVWAVASPRFARQLVVGDDRDQDLEVLAERCPRAIGVGITLGGRGGIARIDGETYSWGPRKVGVIDTTAAGDLFHAGLADAYLQGMTPRQSLQWASALGACICRGLGGRRMLPRDRARMVQFEAAWPELDVHRAEA